MKRYGIKPYEISHIKNGTMKKIGKKRRKQIEILLGADIVKGSDIVPLSMTKTSKQLQQQEYIFILWGLK